MEHQMEEDNLPVLDIEIGEPQSKYDAKHGPEAAKPRPSTLVEGHDIEKWFQQRSNIIEALQVRRSRLLIELKETEDRLSQLNVVYEREQPEVVPPDGDRSEPPTGGRLREVLDRLEALERSLDDDEMYDGDDIKHRISCVLEGKKLPPPVAGLPKDDEEDEYFDPKNAEEDDWDDEDPEEDEDDDYVPAPPKKRAPKKVVPRKKASYSNLSEKTKKRVLDVLQASLVSMTVPVLAKKLKIKETSVKTYLTAMKQEGTVRQGGPGKAHWSLVGN